MTTIAASSAADVGYAKTQNINTQYLQKDVNTQVKYVKNFNVSHKTQIKHNKSIRLLKNENTTKKKTTHSKNTVNEIIKTHATDSKKMIGNSKVLNSLTAKKVVKHSNKNSVNIQINTTVSNAYLKSNFVENSVNTQVKTPTTSVTKQKKSEVKYAAAGSKKKIKKSKINTSSVRKLAASLTRGTKSKYTKAKKIFNWVRDHIQYKFYYNTRYGASGTLKHRVGNCADHAHLIVALSRDAGLKARYVHAKAHFRSGHWYGHVWAQILVNGKWYTADATSSRNSFGVARNWNRAVIKGIYNKLPF